MMTVSKVCFIGDGTTFGCGDETLLGWPGRLCSRVRRGRSEFACYNLGIRLETSSDIAVRWQTEAGPRLGNGGALVFQFGLNDMAAVESRGIRVPMTESLASAEAIISEASAWRPTLWISPLPVLPECHPMHSNKNSVFHYRNDRIAGLNEAYADLAEKLGVPYLDLYQRLAFEREWEEALVRGDGVHPDGEGYALVARQIDQWLPWRQWFEAPVRKAAMAR